MMNLLWWLLNLPPVRNLELAGHIETEVFLSGYNPIWRPGEWFNYTGRKFLMVAIQRYDTGASRFVVLCEGDGSWSAFWRWNLLKYQRGVRREHRYENYLGCLARRDYSGSEYYGKASGNLWPTLPCDGIEGASYPDEGEYFHRIKA